LKKEPKDFAYQGHPPLAHLPRRPEAISKSVLVLFSNYTLARTAKLNDVHPETYLRDVLTKIAEGHKISRIDALFPWNIKPHN